MTAIFERDFPVGLWFFIVAEGKLDLPYIFLIVWLLYIFPSLKKVLEMFKEFKNAK